MSVSGPGGRWEPPMGDKVAALPRDIRNIILPEGEGKSSVQITNQLYERKIRDQKIWQEIAKKWNIEIDPTRNIKDQVVKAITSVTDLALECVTDPADKAAIMAKTDPLQRYALLEKWMIAHPKEAVKFFNQVAYTPGQKAIAASPLFARLILGNININDASYKDRSQILSWAIYVGSSEAVRILLQQGLRPGPGDLLAAVSRVDPNFDIFYLLLKSGATDRDSFIVRNINDEFVMQQDNFTDKLFKELIDRGNFLYLGGLLDHGLVASPKVLAYAREKLGEGSELFKILRDRAIDYSDKAAIRSFIDKRWENLPRKEFVQLFLRDFRCGDFQFFGGIDKTIIKNNPAIQKVILDILKEAPLTKEQINSFIEDCVFYGFDDLLESFLQSGLVKPDHQIPLRFLEQSIKEGKLQIANILIQSNLVEKPTEARIEEYRKLAKANPNVAYLKDMVNLLGGFYQAE